MVGTVDVVVVLVVDVDDDVDDDVDVDGAGVEVVVAMVWKLAVWNVILPSPGAELPPVRLPPRAPP